MQTGKDRQPDRAKYQVDHHRKRSIPGAEKRRGQIDNEDLEGDRHLGDRIEGDSDWRGQGNQGGEGRRESYAPAPRVGPVAHRVTSLASKLKPFSSERGPHKEVSRTPIILKRRDANCRSEK